MECIIVLIFLSILYVIKKALDILQSTHKNSDDSSCRSRSSFNLNHPNNDTLPNGYTRQDYHAHGFSDADIACWGLDQPAAPSPEASGLIVMDMIDGKLDGHIGPLL